MSAGPLSTLELRAAARALTSGGPTPRLGDGRPDHLDLAPIATPTPQMVMVQAAHAGAGASTIALALADAAAATTRVRLLDTATPTCSGLIGASHTEVGATHGWHRGHRGERLLIDRVTDQINTPDRVPTPRTAGHEGFRVVDVGWSSRELAAHPDGWLSDSPAAVTILVTRATPAALRQLEFILTTVISRHLLVAVIRPSRRRGSGIALAGPQLQRLHRADAVVHVPHLGHRAPVLGPDPLPKPLLMAAQDLLDRLPTLTGVTSSTGADQKERR